jgi:hypothetical protein
VPRVTRSGAIAWHRTTKQAAQHHGDLRIDAADSTAPPDPEHLGVDGMSTTTTARRALHRSARLTTHHAEQWFSRMTDVPSLLPIFEDAERQPVIRFGFDNYTQHRLAYAFVLARCDNVTTAHRQLDHWVANEHLMALGLPVERQVAVARRLHELLDDVAH